MLSIEEGSCDETLLSFNPALLSDSRRLTEFSKRAIMFRALLLSNSQLAGGPSDIIVLVVRKGKI